MSDFDFTPLSIHPNMKSNINMNTLTNTEKEGIWVPSLVFSNTEAKVNTVNDPKAFAVARSDHFLLLIGVFIPMNLNQCIRF